MTDQSDLRVHLFHGNEGFLVEEAARNFLTNTAPEAEAQGCLTVIEGDVTNADAVDEVIKQVLLAAQSLSMFGDRNVTWLRRVEFLPGSTLSKGQQVKEGIERLQDFLCKQLGPEQLLVISSGKVDSRSKFLKAIQKTVAVQEFSRSKNAKEAAQEDQAFLQAELKKRNVRPGPQVVGMLLERVEDRRHLISELDKLEMYLRGRAELSVEDVESMVVSNREVPAYEFCSAVAQRRVGRSFELLKQMETQKVSAVMIMSQLTGQFRNMALLRGLIDKGMASISGGHRRNLRWTDEDAENLFTSCTGGKKMHPYRLLLLAEESMKYKAAELDRFARQLAEAYARQFQSSIPSYLQIELAVLAILGDGAKRRSA